MSFDLKRLSGALIVTGLLAACGGEARNLDNAQVDTGLATREDQVLTGAGEFVDCVAGLQYYASGFECWIGSNFTHQYRTGATVTFQPSTLKLWVNNNGFVQVGLLASTQSLYVGPANGTVSFGGGSTVSIHSIQSDLTDGTIYDGTLAAHTCLKAGVNWYPCQGGTRASFYAVTGDLVPTSCTATTEIDCSQLQ